MYVCMYIYIYMYCHSSSVYMAIRHFLPCCSFRKWCLFSLFPEYSRKLKEEQEWLSKAPMEKFRTFLGRKFTLFKISFTNAARSFALIISRYLRKEDGSEHPM